MPRGALAQRVRSTKLKYPEMTGGQIAKRVGCSPDHAYRTIAKFMGDDGSEDSLRDFQANKADIYDAIQRRILSSITEDKLAKAPVQSLVLSAAILEDKARLVRGQATGINVSVMMDAVQAIRELDAGRARQAAAGRAASGSGADSCGDNHRPETHQPPTILAGK